MREDILDLICEYSCNGKYADQEFIERLYNIYVTKQELSDYVEPPVFRPKHKSLLEVEKHKVIPATYNPSTKEFALYTESISKYMEGCNKYDKYFNKLERIMNRNLCIAQVILHELEHVSQKKVYDLGSDDQIKEALIKNSLYVGGKDTVDFDIDSMDGFVFYIEQLLNERAAYYELYDFNPSERLAEIGSYSVLATAIKHIEQDVPELYKFYLVSVDENMIHGYARSINYEFNGHKMCPSEKYLTDIGKREVWESFDFYDPCYSTMMENVREKHNLGKRLTLGLPITKDEFKKTFNMLRLSPKFRE